MPVDPQHAHTDEARRADAFAEAVLQRRRTILPSRAQEVRLSERRSSRNAGLAGLHTLD
jgi:hypothetical protein